MDAGPGPPGPGTGRCESPSAVPAEFPVLGGRDCAAHFAYEIDGMSKEAIGPFGLRPAGLGFHDLVVKDALATQIGIQVASIALGTYKGDQTRIGVAEANVFRADLNWWDSLAYRPSPDARIELVGRMGDAAWGTFQAHICQVGRLSDSCQNVRGRFSAHVGTTRNEVRGSGSFACSNAEDCRSNGKCGLCTTVVYSRKYESSCTSPTLDCG